MCQQGRKLSAEMSQASRQTGQDWTGRQTEGRDFADTPPPRPSRSLPPCPALNLFLSHSPSNLLRLIISIFLRLIIMSEPATLETLCRCQNCRLVLCKYSSVIGSCPGVILLYFIWREGGLVIRQTFSKLTWVQAPSWQASALLCHGANRFVFVLVCVCVRINTVSYYINRLSFNRKCVQEHTPRKVHGISLQTQKKQSDDRTLLSCNSKGNLLEIWGNRRHVSASSLIRMWIDTVKAAYNLCRIM